MKNISFWNVILCILLNVSEERTASIFSTNQKSKRARVSVLASFLAVATVTGDFFSPSEQIMELYLEGRFLLNPFPNHYSPIIKLLGITV
jgi:hypothetical protein